MRSGCADRECYALHAPRTWLFGSVHTQHRTSPGVSGLESSSFSSLVLADCVPTFVLVPSGRDDCSREGPFVSETTEVVDRPASATGEAAAAGTTRKRGTGLSSMVLPELQQLAGSLGITGTARMRKGDLIATIQDRQNGASAQRADQGSSTSKSAAARTTTRSTDRPPARGASRPAGAPTAERPTSSDSSNDPSRTTDGPPTPALTSAPSANGSTSTRESDRRSASRQDTGHRADQGNRSAQEPDNRATSRASSTTATSPRSTTPAGQPAERPAAGRPAAERGEQPVRWAPAVEPAPPAGILARRCGQQPLPPSSPQPRPRPHWAPVRGQRAAAAGQ